MWIFKPRHFAKYARRERIADAALVESVARADRGLVDAELGGHVIKQRVARVGKGRSGGYRVLIAFGAAYRAVFMLGFAKNDRDNITADELDSLKKLAALWLTADAAKIERALAEGVLAEVKHEDEK